MAEELKHLLKQIQKEGVDKANIESDSILSQAKQKAAEIVATAETKAEQILKKAETESAAFAERSTRTLEQAARDLLITVGQGCEKVITQTLGSEVNNSLTASGPLLEQMITNIVLNNEGDASITVSEDDAQQLSAFCATLAKQAQKSVTLNPDSEILSGFKVTFSDQNASLDYTGESIANALAAFLRPELAKTVSGIAREQITK